MEQNIWILGEGPCVVHKQFLTDYKRIPMYIDGNPMPKDPREGVRLLIEKTGRDYYMYTKYMNQTVGNMSMEVVKGMYPNLHLIQMKNSFHIKAETVESHCVMAFLVFQVYSKDLTLVGCVSVTLRFNLKSYTTTITLKDKYLRKPKMIEMTNLFRQTI